MHQFTDTKSLKPFPPEKFKSLLLDLERMRPSGRAVAAFDADGTLWNTDMGEAFFEFIIQNKLVPLPQDPWGHYTHLKDEVSHTEAYVWLAQILRGVPLATVRTWAESSVAERPLPLFAEQMRVLDKLRALKVEIYIVTASITWAVEPAAKRIGVPIENVIGIETAIANGLVTDKPHGVVTYREGKAEAILARTGGLAPYFASGNTEGDRWLLEGALALRLVVSSAPEGTENYPTEHTMLALANERGWYSHRY